MFKWIWRFYTQLDALWARVIKAIYGKNGGINEACKMGTRSCWSNIVEEINALTQKGIALRDFMCFKIGNGEGVSFWEDTWKGSISFKTRFHRLYALEDQKKILISEKMRQLDVAHSFRRRPRGVHVDRDKIIEAANRLGCHILKTPFMYLGSKVGGIMSRVKEWNEVIDRVKMRLSKWKMKALSIGGRLTLLKYQVFNGHDLECHKASWVSWKKVLSSKDSGGLGVSSLFALNRGLMFKWIWRFYTQHNVLWARVIKAIYGENGGINVACKMGTRSCWSNIVEEINALTQKGIALPDFMCFKTGNGEGVSFWEDTWKGCISFKTRFHRLYALEDQKKISVSEKMRQLDVAHSFRRRPRGGIEQDQLTNLVELMQDVSLTPMHDRWRWSLCSDGEFRVATVRKYIDEKMLPVIGAKTRWCKFLPIKINVFAWKICMDALPTRFNISKREKDFCHNNIKNDLRKFKGNDIVDNAGQASNTTTIALGIYKLDSVTLAPKDTNNRKSHIYYLSIL
nr:RNA-directed DNA polymerase, eukaryota, reverse transcriptase zinc-binding domain protein [Tanacetum cinerariifolium]